MKKVGPTTLIIKLAKKLSKVCGYRLRYSFTKNWKDMPDWEREEWIDRAFKVVNYLENIKGL